MVVAGLTGNYGMGKSYALSVFKELGAVTLESDRIVADLLRDKEVLLKVGKILGDGVIMSDGELDKKAVAQRIFSDPVAKKELEGLLHPLVFAAVRRHYCLCSRGNGSLAA
jgi:dephospho-CoA kinase